MEIALYFPNDGPPEISWLMQTVLYWDGAATVSLQGGKPDRFMAHDYMSELIRANLVTTIRAQEAIDMSPQDFGDSFLAMLDSQELPEPWSGGGGPVVSTNIDYMSYDLVRGLNARGLAVPLRMDPNGPRLQQFEDTSWFMTDEMTHDLFFTYLVGLMCRSNSELFPVTDSKESLVDLTTPATDLTSQLRALSYATIMNVLPIPSREISPAELALFKDRHGDQLGRLRRYLHGQLADVVALSDESLRKAKTASILQEISDDVAVLVEQMSKRAWPKIMFAGVGGVLASGLTTGAAVAAGGSALLMGLGIGGAVLSMGPAAYQVADLIRSPRFDERSPLAYAALVHAL
jgi:hypothetical protein